MSHDLLMQMAHSLTYNPGKGQSPTLARANCVILHLMQTGSIAKFQPKKECLD